MCQPLTRWRILPVLLLLVGCQTTVKFDGARLSAADPGPTRRISGLLAKPEGNGPFPGVILLHTCGGLRPHVTSRWPGFLTGLGYVTLTVDSLGPRGLQQCTPELGMDSRELARDAYGALEYLAGLFFVDKERIGVMGFSMGARTVNYLVGRNLTSPGGLNFKAAVSLYACGAFLARSRVVIPLAILIGEKDEMVMSACTSVAHHPAIRVHVLPDAYHAFDSPETHGKHDLGGILMLYSAAATKQAQDIVRDFFAKYLSE